MLGKIIRFLGQTLASTLLLLLALELIFRLLGFPNGATRYAETIIIKNHLSTHKPKDEFRIFALGGSSMHGAHYAPYSSPARWMEAYLKDFLPSKKIRVDNFARMGQNSAYQAEVLQDVLAYKPDLIILYSGHNEFLPGARIDQVRAKKNKWSSKVGDWAKKSHFISAIVRMAIARRLDRGADHMGNPLIESLPSDLGPENAVSRTSPLYKEVIDNYRANLNKMVDIASSHHIPIVIFRPSSNLKNFPPSCSMHFVPLKPEDEKNWNEFFEAGKKAQEAGDLTGSLAFYENASSLDADYSELNFRIAQIYFQQGELEKAKAMFERSRDNDCIITRAPHDSLAVIDDIKASGKAAVIDAEKVVRSEVPGGILGDPIIEDNVHYSIKGHALLGRALVREFADRDWIAPKNEWQFQRERPFEVMSKELGVTSDLMVHSFLECASYFGRKYESRILMAQKALALQPENPYALRQLAWSYWLKGDKVKSFGAYRQLGKLNPKQLEEALSTQPEIRKQLAAAPAPQPEIKKEPAAVPQP